ncbi:MAG: PEP-CTERM system TPR-repeat protein PrsT [Halioglobus sp.]|nr:PEP-CTERM system TPR-repeat protein PrsT [Halioglobus sp.]
MIGITRTVLVLLLGVLLVACGEDMSSEQHLANARQLLAQDNYPPAIVELKAALNKDARLGEARALLGRAYYEIGDVNGAEKELSRALEAGSEVDRNLVVPILAQTLLHIGDYDRLEDLELEGLSGESRSTTLAAKGLAVLFRGDVVVAEDILRTATSIEPPSAYARVAVARLSMAREEYDLAREQLDALLEEAPGYAPAWNLVGDIEAARRRPKKAEVAYSRILKIKPNAFDARLNRAMMRIYQKNFKGARSDLKALRARQGAAARNHPGVTFAEGIVQMQAGLLQQARKSFEKTADFSYVYPLAYYYMAVIDLRQGQHQRALTEVYRFLALAPESIAGPKLAARLELEQEGYVAAETLLLPIVEAYPNDVDSLNLLASALLGQGRGGEGVELLARIVELEPDSVRAKARLGAGYFAAGEWDSGIAVLQDTVRANPRFETADILIVLNHLRRNEIYAAVQAAEEYRKRKPGSVTSYNLLGRAYVAAGKLQQAGEAFRKALEISPVDPAARHGLAEIALQKKRFEQARQYYRQVLRYRENRLETQLKIAASYALEGREQEMINYLQLAIDLHPEATEPVLMLARYYIGTGQLQAAEPLFAGFSDTQREQPDVLATLASFQLASNRYNQALLTLETLIEIRPGVAQYHYMRSKAYAGLGDNEQIFRELQQAVKLDPDHFYAKIALARLALVSGRKELFAERLAELKEMAPENHDVLQLEVAQAQSNGDHKYAAFLLGVMYQQAPTTSNAIALAEHRRKTGEYRLALKLMEEWVKDHPADVRAREKLAELYAQKGHMQWVIDQYRAVVELESDNVVALNNLAWYLLQKEPAEALKYAERAYVLSPQSASVLDTLAMAELHNGRTVEARRYLERALELLPDNPGIRFHEAQLMLAEGRSEGARRTLSEVLRQHGEFTERDEAEALLESLR